jgi:hypothetical protein
VTGSALAVGPCPAAVTLGTGTALAGTAVVAGAALTLGRGTGTAVEALGTGRGAVVPANAAADNPPPMAIAAAPAAMIRARVDLRMNSPAFEERLSQEKTPQPRSGWLSGCDPAHS